MAQITAKIAVERGNIPTKTIALAAVIVCKANAVSKGKPITTPDAIISSDLN